MENKKDKCGVFGISSKDRQVSLSVYSGLMALQHRGQEASGIATFDGRTIRRRVGVGLTSRVFDEKALQYLYGKIGVGHVRYSTTGHSSLENAQPFLFNAPALHLAVALNGNILNYPQLKEELVSSGHVFVSSTDTELIAHLFALELNDGADNDFFEAGKKVMEKLDGAYSVVMLSDKGQLIAFRDPKGFKPLSLGKRGDDVVVASESVALEVVDAQFVREVQPGEMIVVNDEFVSKKLIEGSRHAHCMFEFIYFSRPDTVWEGQTVSDVREKLGRVLARLCKAELDMVVPIPDSGRSAALGFSKESGVPFAEGLVKNRYVWRTFIQPSDHLRKTALKLKLNPVKSVIAGKRVGFVDDSIVRGNTMKKVVKLLRDAGAKEVHLLVSCPPVIAPCYMGVDFPTYKELVAANNSVEEIRQMLGVDSLTYMTLEGLVEAIGLPKEDLCTACLTDVYPTRFDPKKLRAKMNVC
ncbi:MAG: amidophosphoribosyltransferase [Candidatus Micrarchaeia archaeon]